MNKKAFKSEVDFVVRVGGEGGDGVLSCGELFAQAVARTEYHVFTFISYPAEIRGGYSMIQVRVRDWTIYSLGGEVGHLVVFNQQAYDRSIEDIKKGGTVIYDPENVEIKEKNESLTYYPIPLNKISVDSIGRSLGKNVVALGSLGYLFDIDKKVLKELIKDRFGKKGSEIIEKNMKALEAGYNYPKENGWEPVFHLKGSKLKSKQYMLLSGNQAVALGAIAAGCRFVAGYPITPATPIFETLTRLMPRVGGRAIQMEDEIAAISAIIGASFAGEKAMTPTSGPGLQLMGEQLNLASMIEMPIVVVDVQRGGPSTGLPTKTEQSDLKYAIYGGAGESPRIILAPTSVEHTFYQTIRAFNLAERYQLPVIVLLDQSIGYRKATVKMPDFNKVYEIKNQTPTQRIKIPKAKHIDLASRIEPTEEELKDYKRYKITDDAISPVTKPGIAGGQYLATGLEHTEYGKADYSPKVHLKMTKKRFAKLETISKAFELNPAEYHGPGDAKIGVIGWGSTEGAIREARYMAEKEGIKVRHLHQSAISPLPETQIRRFLVGLRFVILVEENYTGQFAHFIKAKFGVRPIEFHKCEGVPFTGEEIFRGIQKVARIIDEDEITKIKLK